MKIWWGLGVVLCLVSSAGPARAETDLERAQREEIAELKRQLNVVVDEVQQLKTQIAVPQSAELKSEYGLGPAASKVYGASRGVSLGGYAEAFYSNQIGDADGDGSDQADFLRAVLYVGNKFTDRLLFNAEIEFEHATTSGDDDSPGSVSVEFASLDYLWRPELNLRAGILLVPMGFVNEVHEPPFFFGTQRPEAERAIIPSTWRENGAGIFGTLGESLSYRAYVVNGFDASGFSSSGLRGGRQKGGQARANDLAFVGRFDFEPLEGLQLGASLYQGDSGQDDSSLPDARTRIWEVHAQYRQGPLHLRGLLTEADVSDAGELSLANGSTVAENLLGGYVEIGYDIMPWITPGSEMSLSPFFRFEYVDPQHDVPSAFSRDRTQVRRLFIPGIHFKPHPNVVLKADYRNIDTFEDNAPDELRFGIGLAF